MTVHLEKIFITDSKRENRWFQQKANYGKDIAMTSISELTAPLEPNLLTNSRSDPFACSTTVPDKEATLMHSSENKDPHS